jgi:hypothetical protein
MSNRGLLGWGDIIDSYKFDERMEILGVDTGALALTWVWWTVRVRDISTLDLVRAERISGTRKRA